MFPDVGLSQVLVFRGYFSGFFRGLFSAVQNFKMGVLFSVFFVEILGPAISGLSSRKGHSQSNIGHIPFKT